MFKNLSVLSSAALIAISISTQAAANDELAASLNTEGTITVCISKNAYPPLYWKENGNLTGFDVESMQAISSSLGLELQFMEVAFDGLIPGIVSGRCDMMRSGLYINEERTKVADAVPYMKTGPALLVLTENADSIKSVDDLSGQTVAAQSASANSRLLDELSTSFESEGKESIDIALYPELPETVAAVQNHRADALIETDVAAASVSNSLNGQFTVIGGLFESGTKFGMYFPKESALKTAVEKSAIKLTEDGTFEKIAIKYGLLPGNIASVEDIQG